MHTLILKATLSVKSVRFVWLIPQRARKTLVHLFRLKSMLQITIKVPLSMLFTTRQWLVPLREQSSSVTMGLTPRLFHEKVLRNSQARKLQNTTVGINTLTGTEKHNTAFYEVTLITHQGKKVPVIAVGLPNLTGKVSPLKEKIVSQIFPDFDITKLRRPSGPVDLLLGADYFGLHPKKELVSDGKNLSIMCGDLGIVVQGFHPQLHEGTQKDIKVGFSVRIVTSHHVVLHALHPEFNRMLLIVNRCKDPVGGSSHAYAANDGHHGDAQTDNLQPSKCGSKIVSSADGVASQPPDVNSSQITVTSQPHDVRSSQIIVASQPADDVKSSQTTVASQPPEDARSSLTMVASQPPEDARSSQTMVASQPPEDVRSSQTMVAFQPPEDASSSLTTVASQPPEDVRSFQTTVASQPPDDTKFSQMIVVSQPPDDTRSQTQVNSQQLIIPGSMDSDGTCSSQMMVDPQLCDSDDVDCDGDLVVSASQLPLLYSNSSQGDMNNRDHSCQSNHSEAFWLVKN